MLVSGQAPARGLGLELAVKFSLDFVSKFPDTRPWHLLLVLTQTQGISAHAEYKTNQPKPTQYLVTKNGWKEGKWWIFPTHGTNSRSSVCSNLGHKHQLQLQDFGMEKMQNSFFHSAARTLWFEASRAGSFGAIFLVLGGLKSFGLRIWNPSGVEWVPVTRLISICIHPPCLSSLQCNIAFLILQDFP